MLANGAWKSLQGSAEGKTKSPPCQRCSEGLRKSSGKLEKLFSSFLRGASCPKSPRLSATAKRSTRRNTATFFMLDRKQVVKPKRMPLERAMKTRGVLLWFGPLIVAAIASAYAVGKGVPYVSLGPLPWWRLALRLPQIAAYRWFGHAHPLLIESTLFTIYAAILFRTASLSCVSGAWFGRAFGVEVPGLFSRGGVAEKIYNSFALPRVQLWRTKSGKEPGHWDSIECGAGVAQSNRAGFRVL